MTKLKRFGGTPVAEGVRLEVGKYTVFAVRNVRRDISVRMRREPRGFLRACMHIPLLRGVVRLVRDVVRFLDGLSEADELKPHRSERGNAFERGLARALRFHPQTLAAWSSALLMLLIAFCCLYAAPKGFESFLQLRFVLTRVQLNAAVCAARILCTLTAIGLCCRLRIFRRLCMYKGAINKAINCYECREPLSVENIARYPLHTRRSEPVFLIGVLIVSMILFACIQTEGILATVIVRILIILATAAVFNEPYSALESAEPMLPVRILRFPMDLMQHMTALEPQPQMLEVAVCAFNVALGETDKEVNPD